MDAKRAREIASSPKMVDVTCNGEPVYIESISGDNTSARIHALNQPNQSRTVALASLVEG